MFYSIALSIGGQPPNLITHVAHILCTATFIHHLNKAITMAKITKASLAELAKKMQPLTREEQASIVGGTQSTYTAFGKATNDQGEHALEGLNQSVFSTQVGHAGLSHNDMIGNAKPHILKKTEPKKPSTPFTPSPNPDDNYNGTPIDATPGEKPKTPIGPSGAYGDPKNPSGAYGDTNDPSGAYGDTNDPSGAYGDPNDPSGYVGDNGGNSDSGSKPFNRNPYRNISYGRGVDSTLGGQITGLLEKSSELRGILSTFTHGGVKLTIEVVDDETMRKGDTIMYTELDGKGGVVLRINSKHVNPTEGFTGKLNTTDNIGYQHDGTVQGTLAVCFAHEAIHAKHISVFQQAMVHCHFNESEAYNYLLQQGYSHDFANIFFTQQNGTWKRVSRDEVATREHDYLRKYNHGVLDRVRKQYGH